MFGKTKKNNRNFSAHNIFGCHTSGFGTKNNLSLNNFTRNNSTLSKSKPPRFKHYRKPNTDNNLPSRISFSRILRIRFLFVCISCAFCFLGYRIFDIQFGDDSFWQTKAFKQHDSSVEIQGVRGQISDTLGRTLAISVPAISVGIQPKKLKKIQEDSPNKIRELSEIVGITKKESEEALAKDKPFLWLKRGLDIDLAHKIKTLELPGIIPIVEFKRYYPQERLAGPLIGRVGVDGYGQSGVEQAFNKQLQAASFKLNMQRDAKKRLIPAYIWDNEKDTNLVKNLNSVRLEGSDIQLTIDSYIQSILEEEFEVSQKETGAKKVFGLIMDAGSGEILALAQSPGFNPNNNDKVSSEKLHNAVIQDSFEPGSTLKPIIAAIALENNVVKKTDYMDCNSGSMKVGKHTIRDVHPVGVASFDEILIRSSNICMAKMGLSLGTDKLRNGLLSFGFNNRFNIGIPGEAKGVFNNKQKWSEIDLATHSFGQGFAVTALQLVSAYAVIANDGVFVQPTFIKSGKTLLTKEVISKKTAQAVNNALKGVTENKEGTGGEARIEGLRVSGKTGTAQKPAKNRKGYDPDRILSSFIGFINAGDVGIERKLVMYVAVDEPSVKPRWGGKLAGPVFRKAMERVIAYLLSHPEANTKISKDQYVLNSIETTPQNKISNRQLTL